MRDVIIPTDATARFNTAVDAVVDAGRGVVLLALLGRPPCPLSRCQRMDITILSVAQAATVDMRAVLPCSGKIPPPQTPVMLAGGRPIPTR